MQSAPAGEPSRKPPPQYLAVIRAIDAITLLTGYFFTLLVAPLIVANVAEVFMRYVMNAPTSWALDVTTMSYGALFMLGAAYALLVVGAAGLFVLLRTGEVSPDRVRWAV